MAPPVAIVTGASSGIGLALTKFLLERNWAVVMADLNEPKEKLDNTLFIKTDIFSWDQQATMFKQAYEWQGRLDFFAANAGMDDRDDIFASISSDSTKPPKQPNMKTFDVNLTGTYYGIKLAAHYMSLDSKAAGKPKVGGKIVVTASAAGIYPLPSVPQYAATKHGLVGLARSMGPVGAAVNIRINALCPALVTTGLLSSALQDALEDILTNVGQADYDIADYPNPFYKYHSDSNPYAVSRQLTLVDGGEDLQNVPLHPLIQPEREVDVIFAVDSSADTNASLPTNASALNWPDGASLVATYERSLASIQNGTAFPAIPDINTFFNLGLNNRPTFFGCDASNLTGPSPLIVYMPNAPYVYNSNVSTYDLQYNDTERNAIVMNGYNGATQGNGTLDSQWPTCVGCAILSRSFNRTNTKMPDVCTQCFDRYCWNGTTDSSPPANYVPAMKLDAISVKSGASTFTQSMTALVVSVAAAVYTLA